MSVMAANQISPAYELKDELARSSLVTGRREPERKLAWVNSVCLLFLLIGVLGARRGMIAIKPVPPLQEPVPVITQPAVLPPQPAAMKKPQMPQANSQKPLVVVVPNAPSINFSVPTAGTLATAAALAPAPQIAPAQIRSVQNTGSGGDRPEPPYPPIALETGEQGTVVLILTGDDAGNIISADVKQSSGFPVLDRATVDFVKHHWRLPTDTATRSFETSITYQLQLN